MLCFGQGRVLRVVRLCILSVALGSSGAKGLGLERNVGNIYIESDALSFIRC